MKTLQSTTDFVLERASKDILEYTITDAFKDGAKVMNEIFNHAKTLKLKPELWMFIPTDSKGNVLEEPTFHEPNNESEIGDYDELRQQYQTALSKVWFKGFEYNPNGYVFKDFDKFDDEWFFNATIEDLTPYNLEITENFGKNLLL